MENTLTPDQLVALNSVHSATGISYKPSDVHAIPGGVDSHGKTFYVNPKLANDNNLAGGDHVAAFQKAFDPFGIVDPVHQEALNGVATVSTDGKVISDIDKVKAGGGSTKEVVGAILGNFNPALKNVSKALETQAGTSAATAAHAIATKWDTLSPAQKSIGIATVGIQGIPKFAGTNLLTQPVPNSASLVDGKTISVGAGVEGLKGGLNSYSLGKNWPQIDAVGKIAYGTKNLAQGAQVGAMLGMLGTGTEGSTVNINQDQLAKMGATPAPHLGIGAIKLAPGSTLPKGYSLLPAAAGSAAIPTANLHSSTVSPQTTSGKVSRISSVEDGTHPVMKHWDLGDAPLQGTGGSAMAAGVNALNDSNPYLLGGIHAFSALSGIV